MSPRFVLGRENVPCVAEVVNRSLKADCTDFNLNTMKTINQKIVMWRFSLHFWPTFYWSERTKEANLKESD